MSAIDLSLRAARLRLWPQPTVELMDAVRAQPVRGITTMSAIDETRHETAREL